MIEDLEDKIFDVKGNISKVNHEISNISDMDRKMKVYDKKTLILIILIFIVLVFIILFIAKII